MFLTPSFVAKVDIWYLMGETVQVEYQLFNH
jgi:hypothetical protein